MAEDSAAAIVGTSTGQLSRRAANREAMKKCASMGGKNCKLAFTYENTCAVIAEPIETLSEMFAYFQDGPTIDEASVLAIERCAARNNGHECKIIYSNCTSPVLVQ